MNNLSLFQNDHTGSIESELEEISARLRLKSVDFEFCRVELILARKKAQSCLKQAITAWKHAENGCDHSTSDQRRLHLELCELEAAQAAIEYLAQIGTVEILATEHRKLIAVQSKLLGIIQEQLESHLP